MAPMEGRANHWGARQPFDLHGNRKSHFSVSVSKKSTDGLFTILSNLMTLQEVMAPMEGRANHWGARQPFDLYGNRKSHFSVFVRKKSMDGLFTILSN